jgi:hypothetical protein
MKPKVTRLFGMLSWMAACEGEAPSPPAGEPQGPAGPPSGGAQSDQFKLSFFESTPEKDACRWMRLSAEGGTPTELARMPGACSGLEAGFDAKGERGVVIGIGQGTVLVVDLSGVRPAEALDLPPTALPNGSHTLDYATFDERGSLWVGLAPLQAGGSSETWTRESTLWRQAQPGRLREHTGLPSAHVVFPTPLPEVESEGLGLPKLTAPSEWVQVNTPGGPLILQQDAMGNWVGPLHWVVQGALQPLDLPQVGTDGPMAIEQRGSALLIRGAQGKCALFDSSKREVVWSHASAERVRFWPASGPAGSPPQPQ